MIMNGPMTRAAFTVAIALLSHTAAAAPEQVTCDSPCDCRDAHGEGRWSVKTDAFCVVATSRTRRRQSTKVPQQGITGDAAKITEDFSVANGLDLARTTIPFPYGIAELNSLDPTQRAAIQQEKRNLENSLDSLRDVRKRRTSSRSAISIAPAPSCAPSPAAICLCRW